MLNIFFQVLRAGGGLLSQYLSSPTVRYSGQAAYTEKRCIFKLTVVCVLVYDN